MERRSRTAWLALALLASLLAAPLRAQDIPPALRDWQGWVLHDVPERACPLLSSPGGTNDARQCTWPGRLALQADATGARFTLQVRLDAPGWVALPGDTHDWPQQVRADGQPQPVLNHDGEPALRLDTGTHRLDGALAWSSRPSTLALPRSIALVDLSIDGVPVERIERNDERLTLGEAAAAARAADALSLRVYRQLVDGLPPTLETRLQLNVAGTAREQLLGPALPNGFVATALSGDLPARLESDGRLRVQLRPGQWEIVLDARATAPLKDVTWTPPGAPWPAQDIWSYADNTDLRGTRVEGQGVDANRAGVPTDWLRFPAFAMDASHGLVIAEGNRGDQGGQGDQLQLQRELWLDFDGHGLNAVDHLTGTLRHHQRLDVGAPWQLQRASQGGQPLLISQGENGHHGVELRQQALDLRAGLRVPQHGGSLPSGGWLIPLEGIDATLHLPPGYRLLGAPGADGSPDSWVAQWTLLDLFVVALIALLAGRALGWPWAALAAVFLALAQHEGGAPRWTLAVALALALLLRALPDGRLRAAARLVALAAFALAALWTLPFATTQLEYALHPQLETGAASRTSPRMVQARMMEPARVAGPQRAQMEVAAAPPPPAPPAPPADIVANVDEASTNPAPSSAGVLASITVSGSVADAFNAPLDSRSVVQAGAGEPHWELGNAYRLSWSGPVTVQQTTRLVIAPAWLVRLLRVLMVALLGALLARMLPLLVAPLRGHWNDWRRGAASAAVLLLAMLGPHAAHARQSAGSAIPDRAMLDQLRARLTEAPPCTPHCVAIADAQLQAAGDTLDVTLDAHAGADVGLPLPQGDAALMLIDARLDAQPAALASLDGVTVLRLDRGVHRVTLQYRIAAGADSVTLGFPLHPGHVGFIGSGWSAGGLDDERLLGDSLALSRQRAATDGSALAITQSLPPYVRVTRRLSFGVDWAVQTTVERLAPHDGGFSVSLPLLPGEHPQGEGSLVRDGAIQISFRATDPTITWTSRLDRAPTLVLKAPPLGQRAEVWQIDAAPMWHVAASGVPGSATSHGLRFQPLPGETLTLALSEPKAVAGSSLAFDQVTASTVAGERASETALALTVRSTRGGEHALALPAGAELLQARRDGEPLNLALREGQIALPLLPGEHDYQLVWRERRGVSVRTSTSTVDLHAPVANIALELHLPQDRWVLWTWGPSMGPAVLYWSQLAVLLLAAWLLARYAPTPLRFHHWLLLGLGFSAFAWSAFALVVAWLIALGWRARGVRLGDVAFNLLQVALALLTALALLALVGAVPRGLLGLPDMHVAGNGSSAWELRWFADQSAGALPRGGVLSVSLWVYKLAMLAWALWLANALIGWLRWAFAAWSEGGYWRRRAVVATPPELPAARPGEAAVDD
ncbi:hypothetical protein [Dyella sp.]|jgi:hypothetical protein|uniref:hypothetical protein n=1 Tax=Dyella sp. TaxID=1869338 RepID=UPI002D79E870|nr:hypothetical protein [Dyella sp.]HET6430953.1 hypothetical protein [Dyella sp.]